MTAQGTAPSVGDEGFVQEPHTLSVILKCLPKEVRSAGARKQVVSYSCFDVSDQYLALGSEQGYVWILDLHATKLTREINDLRGTAITTVALNTRQEYIAYGSRDGQTRIEPLSKQTVQQYTSRKYRIQEKDRQAVVAMVWDHTGTQLLCGYMSGKIVKASFQFGGDVMDVCPLLECGSVVVQLSACGHSLLISTLARSLLLDVDSGRVTQVGTKERKSGPFGGCFFQSSPPADGGPSLAFLARPGLRVWTADDSGKVILTTKFRGPLSSGKFPRVPTHNWSPGTPHFTDTWQFSQVLPWLQTFIVSYHQHTLWVLDPKTSTVVGVLCLEHPITSVVTHGKFVYVLCSGLARPLARFTVHQSYLRGTRDVKSEAKTEEDVESVHESAMEGSGEGGERGRGGEGGERGRSGEGGERGRSGEGSSGEGSSGEGSSSATTHEAEGGEGEKEIASRNAEEEGLKEEQCLEEDEREKGVDSEKSFAGGTTTNSLPLATPTGTGNDASAQEEEFRQLQHQATSEEAPPTSEETPSTDPTTESETRAEALGKSSKAPSAASSGSSSSELTSEKDLGRMPTSHANESTEGQGAEVVAVTAMRTPDIADVVATTTPEVTEVVSTTTQYDHDSSTGGGRSTGGTSLFDAVETASVGTTSNTGETASVGTTSNTGETDSVGTTSDTGETDSVSTTSNTGETQTDVHIQSSHNDDPHLDAEPISKVDLTLPPTEHQSTQSNTTSDTTAAGPTAMQDLRREVTDLLRPALGKLSGLVRYQERRREGARSGQNSGTTTPQELPVVDLAEEGEQGGGRLREGGEEGGGSTEGETATPMETPGISSPKLIMKLGGRLGGLISGDKDKQQDQDSPQSPSLLGMRSADITPSPMGVEENERRLRMAQAASGEDTISERLTQRKKKKKKTKKHTLRSSSASASMEKLTEIADTEDMVSLPSEPMESPQVEPASDTTTTKDVNQDQAAERVLQLRNELPLKLAALAEAEELSTSLGKLGIVECTVPVMGHSLTSTEPRQGDLEQTQPGTEPGPAGEETVQLSEAVHREEHSEITTPISITTRDELLHTDTVIQEPVVATPPPSLPDHSTMEQVAPPDPAELQIRVTGSPEIINDGAVSKDAHDTDESAQSKGESCSPLQEYSGEHPSSAREGGKKFLKSVEVTKGSDPLSLLQSDDESYFKPVKGYPKSRDIVPEDEAEAPKSSVVAGKLCEKSGSSEESRQFVAEEIPSELSDNPLYGDDTSDFTNDSESSQQRSRRGSSAKLPGSSRSSSLAPPTSSLTFASKHMKSKGAASLGASHAVSDHSWESTGPRQRSEHIFTPSVSPFEVSNSPGDLSCSFQSSLNPMHLNQHQQQSKAAGLSPPTAASLPPPPASLPVSVNLFQEGRRLGEDSGSDFSCEEDDGAVEPEHFSLCAAAVDDTRSQSQGASIKSPSPLLSSRQRLGMESFYDDGDQQWTESSPDPEADIWVTVPHPCRGHVQSICLSDRLLWLVDSRNMVYCTDINSKGKKWELIKHPMQLVISSPSGSIVWGLYRQNAYVRLGIELNVAGQTWKNITKNTSLQQKIKYVCADDSGVWAVKADGQIIFRKGVTETVPHGRVWVEVGRAASFTSVTSCSGVVWATNASGRLFYRDGVSEQNPSGRKWVDMKAPPLEAVCMTQGNIAWIIDGEGKMGFRCGISRAQPMGKNPWWEVSVSTTLSHSSLPFNSLWQVMTSEGSQFFSSVSSLIHTHLPGHHKLLAVSASNRAGVCVLESGSKLHACWRSTTGYHYSSASKDGVFQLTTWTMFGSGSTGMWVVRDDGELYCITPQEKFIRIECASTVQMMVVSSTALWVIANNQLWSRQGMSTEVPEGISWDYIELSPQLHSRKLKHIVCGKRAVWAIDGTGIPHFRFGVHSREPGTGMSPAWVPVDDLSHPLHQITVSQNDWLVWACDENYNAYARTGVTQDFPVGQMWDLVPGQQVKQLCAYCKKIYALTPSGNLLCRYGITESNAQGNYWRQMPGHFVQIAIGPQGRLLGLDSKGSILKQQSKTITVAQDSEFLRHRFDEVLDQSWEVV